MKLLLLVSALTAVALASDDYAPAASAYSDNSYGAYVYRGKYPGKCGNDGLYFKNEASFVFCSNGNSYVQPCAPGTRNSAYSKYSYGGKYDYRDFCDVNLVDEGYAAKKSAAGYVAPKADYKEPAAPAYPAKDGYGQKDGYAADAKYDYGYAGRDFGYAGRDYGYGNRYYGYGYPNYGYGYQPYGYPY